ncbi:hypothetical protein ACFFIX_19575 [Metabacillus herbersteinensis]|uniref:Uncharacterized protein n=1 Tax=Metabacillus herbersteinensis TaxID=283816 RepID=A0ABV6GJA4_9BACI
MGLMLVVDNSSKDKIKKLPTCRKNCELFDPITNQCGINHNINADDPYLAARCGDMIYKDETDDSVFIPHPVENVKVKYTLIEDEFECELEDDFFKEFNGQKFDILNSTYPSQPDYPANRDDAIWYVSPCGKWGAWVVNKSKKRFLTVTNVVKNGWSTNVYMSPYPLHDHNSSLTLASRMAWFVDEDGYGQYVILGNGKISMISSTRPEGWTGK